MIHRFQDWRFRNKLISVTIAPVGVVTLLLAGTFYSGLEKVWRNVVPRQANLLELESLAREYQSEIREHLLLRDPETLREIDEIHEQLPTVLARLSPQGDAGASQPLLAELQSLTESLVGSGRRLLELPPSLGDPAGAGEVSQRVEDELNAFERAEKVLEDRIDLLKADAENQLAVAFQQFGRLILTYAAIGLVIGALLALQLARWISAPLTVLREASQRILDGDYRAGERIRSREELGQLAAGFDRASEEIRQLVAEKENNLAKMRQNQAQLLQSGKLAAVGELASGVAHEINNPLSAVLTYSMLLLEKAEKAPPEIVVHIPKLVERLKLIETAAVRCRDIADKLLTFARQDDSEKQLVHLGKVAQDSLELMKPTLQRKSIGVELEVDSDLPPILANANQLQQVLVNLVTNASYAVDVGGRLEVAVRHRGEICELAISDDGPGIDPSVLDRIFEPFVTTKPQGKGTGLGLSIVYGIVQAHDGEITVDSRPGAGTTFTLRLPIAESIG